MEEMDSGKSKHVTGTRSSVESWVYIQGAVSTSWEAAEMGLLVSVVVMKG